MLLERPFRYKFMSRSHLMSELCQTCFFRFSFPVFHFPSLIYNHSSFINWPNIQRISNELLPADARLSTPRYDNDEHDGDESDDDDDDNDDDDNDDDDDNEKDSDNDDQRTRMVK